MANCGLGHIYDERVCVLPEGHEVADFDRHESADGFKWTHHAELIDEGEDVWDVWDEPVESA